MNVKDTVEFLQQYLAEYVHALFDAVVHPTRAFQSVRREARGTIIMTTPAELRMSLDPRLLSFGVLSVVCGTVFHRYAGITEGILSLDRVIYTVFFWLVASVAGFGVAKLLRGRAGFFEVVTYCFQVLSAIFVICSVVHLLWIVCVRSLSLDIHWDSVLTQDTVSVYFIVQLLLLTFYFAIGIARLNRFGFFRSTIFAIVVGVSFVVLNVGMFVLTELPIMASPPQPTEHLRVEVRWLTPLDVDLHLQCPDGMTLSYQQPLHPTRLAHLLNDERTGPAMETILFQHPLQGRYVIQVHRYSPSGKTRVFIEVFTDEQRVWTEVAVLNDNLDTFSTVFVLEH